MHFLPGLHDPLSLTPEDGIMWAEAAVELQVKLNEGRKR